jgi:adenylylsulfate kinase-like enzyme
MFPANHFGRYILNRQSVIKKVEDTIQAQKDFDSEQATSVYLAGCRGSGKTSLQTLLARSFKAKGYEVYFFVDAN